MKLKINLRQKKWLIQNHINQNQCLKMKGKQSILKMISEKSKETVKIYSRYFLTNYF